MKSIFTLLLFLSTVLSAAARHDSRLERHPDGSATLMVGGQPYIIIGGETGNSMDYIVAGTGIVLTFSPDGQGGSAPLLGEDGFLLTGTAPATTQSITPSATHRIGLASVEEVSVAPDGSLTRIRTLNGDETHQGRHVRIGVDEFKILHVTLYPY